MKIKESFWVSFCLRDAGPIASWHRVHLKFHIEMLGADAKMIQVKVKTSITIHIPKFHQNVGPVASFYTFVSPTSPPTMAHTKKPNLAPPPPTKYTYLATPISHQKLIAENTKIADDIRSILQFHNKPSKQLLAFYEFTRSIEHSEENLECFLSLRNHSILYRRYKALKKQYYGDGQTEITVSSESSDFKNLSNATSAAVLPPFMAKDLDNRQIGSLDEMVNNNIGQMYVDRKVLRYSARSIVHNYLVPGSTKEVNISSQLREKVVRFVEEDKRYDPTIFSDIRDCLFIIMKEQSYPHFLRQLRQESI